jgi:hypothetical protein
MFKLAVGRAPLDEGNDLASGPTLSRLENSVSKKDSYRLAKSFVEALASLAAKLEALENAAAGVAEPEPARAPKRMRRAS